MTQIGPCELGSRIGKGGMGSVWYGRIPGFEGISKPVAVKVIEPGQGASAEEFRRRFWAEARVASQLWSANAVQVLDSGEENGRFYLIMELIEGMDLAELLDKMRGEQGWLSVRLSAYVVGQVLRGLQYAHELKEDGRPLGVVHRDIAPANVLSSPSSTTRSSSSARSTTPGRRMR